MGDTALMIQEKGELSIAEMQTQVAKLQELMKAVMREGEHYGIIPGTTKPSLYKAGAEKLGFVFRLRPEFEITRDIGADGHREYEVVCTLYHMGNGVKIAQGVGNCSTMESKYRYRQAQRVCPSCGQEAIIKGKADYGGGWLCWAKKGGCGAKYPDGDTRIEDQKIGQTENPDIADVFNTVKKMAKKRAHVDAIITACAASDIFTQDVEDFKDAAPEQPRDKYASQTDEQLKVACKRGLAKLSKLPTSNKDEVGQMIEYLETAGRADIVKMIDSLKGKITAAEKAAAEMDASEHPPAEDAAETELF